MRLGVLISYYHSGAEALAQLRVLVDSLRRHVPDGYDRLLILDDCSPHAPEWDAYQEHLRRDPRAVVYRLGPPRIPYYHAGGKGLPPRTSYGHAHGIMAGFHRLRDLGCSHAWVIDADCSVVDGGWLGEATRLFAHERVAVVTDYLGGRPSRDDQLVDERYEITVSGSSVARTPRARKPCRVAGDIYGFPVLFCGIVDLAVEERFGLLYNSGWVNSRWGQRLFRQGYRVAFFPFFQGGHVYHLGYGLTRYNAGTSRTFGNLIGAPRYGGKQHGCYHAGYLQLNRTAEECERWLGEIAATPLDREAVLPREWLVPPIDVPLHGRDDVYLRPFEPGDLAALCEIDSDPETVRYLSWGPHGVDATGAFLDRAIEEHRRWHVLAEGESGRLIGYGEIRPLPVEHADERNPAGIVYVIHPAHRGRGLGSRLLSLLVYRASLDEHDAFYVAIDEAHSASIRCVEKTGRAWGRVRTEPYTLKGEARTRLVFRFAAHVSPPEPPADPAECHRERERFLFDELGMWR